MATASVLIVPDTTKFAALLTAELGAATTATGTLGAASAVTAKSVTTEARALQLAGASAVVSARATREAALAHEQLARGAGATVLSLGGVRGATLAASGPFLAGAAAVTIFAKSVKEAAKEEEAAARVSRILGEELGAGSERWAKTLADSFGLSATAALKFEGAIAEVFHNVGISTGQTAQLSQGLVQLSADVAAFNNVSNDQVLRAFQLALSGNLRGLRQFVPGVTAASVALRAMTDTGKTTVASLTQQELVLARVEEIQRAAANQTGAFAARQGNLAAQTKILESNLANLGASLGTAVIPVLVAGAQAANKLVKGVKDLIEEAKRVVAPIEDAGKKTGVWDTIAGGLKNSLFLLGHVIDDLDKSLHKTNSSLDFTIAEFNATRGPISFFTNSITQAGNAFDVAAAKFRQGLHLQVTITTNQADTAGRNLLRLQAEGAPLSEQLTAAQKEIAAAQKAVNAADALTAQGSSQTQKVVEDRLQALKSARGDAESIQSQIDALSKAGVKAAAKAEKTAQQLLDEQDQRLATEQGLAQGEVSIKQALAKRTRSLVDDLSVLKAQVVLLGQQIVQAAKIHDVTTRLQTIQQLTLERIQTGLDIQALKEEQAQRKKDHLALLRDRAEQRLELNIEIADTNKNIRAEIAARNARIAFDREQLKSVHGDIVRRKQLQLQIAQDTQAIKDLKKQQDAKGDAFRSLTFSFLQAQQGFAANLLSNLLPSGAASGAVGGRVASVAPSGPAPPLGPGTALGRDGAVAAGGAGGATQGQMAALLEIQRAMLVAFRSLVGTQKHPEARNQRVAASADMAYGNAGN